MIMAAINWNIVMVSSYPAACRYIRRMMPCSLRPFYDPEDFVSSALVEVVAHPEKLIILNLIAKRKMLDGLKSPKNKIVSLFFDIRSKQPSQENIFSFNETRDRILSLIPLTSRFLPMAKLRIQGYSLKEISTITHTSVKSTQRLFKKFSDANKDRFDGQS